MKNCSDVCRLARRVTAETTVRIGLFPFRSWSRRRIAFSPLLALAQLVSLYRIGHRWLPQSVKRISWLSFEALRPMGKGCGSPLSAPESEVTKTNREHRPKRRSLGTGWRRGSTRLDAVWLTGERSYDTCVIVDGEVRYQGPNESDAGQTFQTHEDPGGATSQSSGPLRRN
jgi:hypothetical protein